MLIFHSGRFTYAEMFAVRLKVIINIFYFYNLNVCGRRTYILCERGLSIRTLFRIQRKGFGWRPLSSRTIATNYVNRILLKQKSDIGIPPDPREEKRMPWFRRPTFYARSKIIKPPVRNQLKKPIIPVDEILFGISNIVYRRMSEISIGVCLMY
jgi:hypothetical protein